MAVIVYVDRSSIRDGKADALERAAEQLAEHVAAGGSRALSYAIHFAEDRATMTVVHVHPDTESLEQLLDDIAPRLAPFRELLDLEAIDLYGDPSRGILDRLARKTQLLGGTVRVHRRVAGADRALLHERGGR